MNLLIRLNVFLFLMSGILLLTADFKHFSIIINYFSLLLFVFFTIVFNKKLRINWINFIFLFVFIIICFVSAFVNADLALFNRTVKQLIDYVALVIILPSIFKITEKDLSSTIEKSLYITVFPLILYSLIHSNPLVTPFKGVFANPNSMGLISVIVSSVLLARIVEAIKKSNFDIYLFLRLILICLLAFIIIQSSSRTSFVTLIVLVFLSIYNMFNNPIKIVRYNKKALLLLPLILLIPYFIFRYFNFSILLQETIIEKFERRTNDQLSGRTDIWLQTIEESTLFGNGAYYFLDNFNFGAHNLFISVLGNYGWIGFVFFTLFFIHSCILILKHYKLSKYNNNHDFFSIFVLTSFLLMSLMEHSTLLMYIFYLLIGNVLITKSKYIPNK